MIRNAPKDAAVYGVDLGKNTFHVLGLDPSGAVVQRVKFRRDALLAFLSERTGQLSGWKLARALNGLPAS